MSNSSIDLRASRSLQLLNSLVLTAREFAEREEQTTKFFQTRRHGVNRRRSNELAAVDLKLAKQIEDAEVQFAAEEEQIRSLHGDRATRIRDAQSKCLRTVLTLATRAKERWLSDLQMRHFQVKKALPARLKAADNELAEIHGKLAGQVAILTDLRKRAQRATSGYLSLAQVLQTPPTPTPEGSPPAEERDGLLKQLQGALEAAGEQIRALRRKVLPRLFSVVPPVVFAVLLVVAGGVLAVKLGFNGPAFEMAGIAAAATFAVVLVLHHLGYRQAKGAVASIAELLATAAQLHDACALAAQARHQQDRDRAQVEYNEISSQIHEQWKRADYIENDFSEEARVKINSQVPRLLAENEKRLQRKITVLHSQQTKRLTELRQEADAERHKLTESQSKEINEILADENAVWAALEEEWKTRIGELYSALAEMNRAAQAPSWDSALLANWNVPTAFANASRFAHLELDLAGTGQMPQRLTLPAASHLSVPLCLSFPEEGSLLFEARDGGAVTAGPLNNVILRLLTQMPPGKLSFTILDPIGLGQNFAGLMNLGDYEESLISRRIWTQREQIDDRLIELNEHIEKVIQMYLRNEYATISEYNAQAGSVAEKYHFLVVADFPAEFTESSIKRLQSIAVSGPRCGVFTLIHWDQRQPMPDGFVADDLRKHSICLHRDDGRWVLTPEQAKSGSALVLDPPPETELELSLVHKIGKASIDSNRVQVPFVSVAPKREEFWTGETTNELRIAIGRTGATKLQYLAIGKGTRQHALFAGKTGSGKSTLFHVIITNLAVTCSPEQVEFYLIDFKKGVEFKCYATHRLPHARVVAIESDREFGLSVLQRVDDELKRRGDLFRKLGVQDIPGYKRVGGTEPMPRSLLIIDEFQEFFVEDDEIAQTASVLFDRIVRQGRAFGIHVLLGSQTLGGAYTLARATLGQMVIRVALQCNEADAYLIMDENNSAPRLLSRPGEGIYNDAAGAVEGNSPFQVVWLSDEERDGWLAQVSEVAATHHDHHPAPIVFEGNAPADLRENYLLEEALASMPLNAPVAPRIWLGAPNSIKGPTEAVFQRQSGNHLFIVGQREEAALVMLGVSLVSLAAQYPAGGATFILLHNAPPGSQDAEFISRISSAIPHGVRLATSVALVEVMNDVAGELKRRGGDLEAVDAKPVFLLIHGLQRFKKLRQEDDFDFSGSSDSGSNPSAQFTSVIMEGSSLGIHLVVTVDTYNNVSRFLSRKAVSEIEMRILFQMSANDSASLIDSPKASGLGLHRALLYNEQQGSLETFRPYATPESEWIEHAAAQLAKRSHT